MLQSWGDRDAARVHSAGVNAAYLTPSGSRAVTVSGDHTARVWDIATAECRCVLRGNQQPAPCYSQCISMTGHLTTLPVHISDFQLPQACSLHRVHDSEAVSQMHEHIKSTQHCLGAVLVNMRQLVSEQAFCHANRSDLASKHD